MLWVTLFAAFQIFSQSQKRQLPVFVDTCNYRTSCAAGCSSSLGYNRFTLQQNRNAVCFCAVCISKSFYFCISSIFLQSSSFLYFFKSTLNPFLCNLQVKIENFLTVSHNAAASCLAKTTVITRSGH